VERVYSARKAYNSRKYRFKDFFNDTICGEDGCLDIYQIDYNFSVSAQQGIRYAGTSEVDRSTFERLNAGDVVRITYLSGNPNISWITGHIPYRNHTLGLIPVLLVVAATMLAILFAVRLTLRTRRLMREGQLLRADVTTVEVQEGTDPESGSYVATTLYLWFRTPRGRQIPAQKVLNGNFDRLRDAAFAVLYVNDDFYELL
jgi:hypothetical protein